MSSPLPVSPVFVLFDDAQSPVDAPTSRLLTDPIAVWQADAAGLATAFDRVEAEFVSGRHVTLLLHYEAALPLAGLPVAATPPGQPVLHAAAFAQAQTLSAPQVDDWLAQQIAALPTAERDAPAGVAALQPGIARADYDAALARIREHLAAGDCYQINFTWPLRGRAFGHPLRLYQALRARQPTRWRALARLPDRWVLSLSPEQFFVREGRRLQARPMKGTAPRHADPALDAQAAQALAADAKNRAENLMILDLLRNDLGRLARPGTVQVPARFTVEPYPTVWQMTSTVEAELREPAPRWRQIFASLFPCGSVTGAPKHKSMEIIAALEGQSRGLYTGAIGHLDPHADRAAFNVPIRTLEIVAQPDEAGVHAGTRALRTAVGSGVVIDSDPDAEWAECWDKLRFVTAHDPGFALIETFAAVWPAQAERIERHLARLAASASYFNFACDMPVLRAALQAAHAGLHAPAAAAAQQTGDAWAHAAQALAPASHRTRIVLRKGGDFDLEVQPLPAPPAQPVRLLLGTEPLDATDLFLRHKTTHRARYDAAWRTAEAQGAFDQIFVNQRGEVCEGGRCSVFARIDGRWFTPPLSSGLLPGVARQMLIDSGACAEQVLRVEDLRRADALAVANAVRGVLAVRLD